MLNASQRILNKFMDSCWNEELIEKHNFPSTNLKKKWLFPCESFSNELCLLLEKYYPRHIYSPGLCHKVFNIILVEMICLHLFLCLLLHDHFYIWKLEYELAESRHVLLVKQNYSKLGVMACTSRGISHNINAANTDKRLELGTGKLKLLSFLMTTSSTFSLLLPGLLALFFFPFPFSPLQDSFLHLNATDFRHPGM